MAFERRIDLVPPVRVGALLAAALPLPDGWNRGVTFSTTGCIGPFTVGPCPTDVNLKAATRPGLATFAPVSIGAALECSTLGHDVTPAAGDVLDVTAEFAIARELATGNASERDNPDGGNPSLTGSVTDNLGDLGDPTAALACLEQRASAATYGRTVYVHTSPAVGTHLAAAGAIWRDGTRWRTAAGSPIVLSPGYTALAAFDGITSLPMFATGPVYAAIGQRDTLADVNREVNTATARVEDIALAVFDPCYVGAVGSSLSPCVDDD